MTRASLKIRFCGFLVIYSWPKKKNISDKNDLLFVCRSLFLFLGRRFILNIQHPRLSFRFIFPDINPITLTMGFISLLTTKFWTSTKPEIQISYLYLKKICKSRKIFCRSHWGYNKYFSHDIDTSHCANFFNSTL